MATTKQALTVTSSPTGEQFLFRDSFRSPEKLFRFIWTLAPGKTGPGKHWHDEETESFHVLEGVLTIWMKGKRGDYGPGMKVSIPPRVPHRFKNFEKKPAVVEVTLDGPRMEDMFVPLAAAARARGLGTELPLSMIGVFLVMMVEGRSSTPNSAVARAVFGGMAKVARLLGSKPLPPVQGWADSN